MNQTLPMSKLTDTLFCKGYTKVEYNILLYVHGADYMVGYVLQHDMP